MTNTLDIRETLKTKKGSIEFGGEQTNKKKNNNYRALDYFNDTKSHSVCLYRRKGV